MAATTALADGPCLAHAYRLSGPLQDWLCGVHLHRDWRLAFTADTNDKVVLVVFIDRYRAKGFGLSDPWDHLHALCGLINLQRDHKKPECREGGELGLLPDVYLDSLDEDLLASLKEKHGR